MTKENRGKFQFRLKHNIEGNRRKYFWSFLEGNAGLKMLGEDRGARYLYHVEVPS